MPLSYRDARLSIATTTASKQQIKDLQRDLRALCYLRHGIDGGFGPGTDLAIKGLQYDLLRNTGQGKGDGPAPVPVADFNRGRVTAVTGLVDPGTADCIAEMLADSRFPQLPRSSNAVAENRAAIAAVLAAPVTKVPKPFLLAIFNQESNIRHFSEPTASDEDSFITVGLDHGGPEKHIITSRGYGLGQYTLFHHPPRAEEVDEFMRDPVQNMGRAVRELRDKFDHFVNAPGSRAEDRITEVGSVPLRVCKFPTSDPRYLNDCAKCMADAGQQTIRTGDPVFAGSSIALGPTAYHAQSVYENVPIRKNIPCDWPYAVRRYNGGGVDSYHYQFSVLKQVARPPAAIASASAPSTAAD